MFAAEQARGIAVLHCLEDVRCVALLQFELTHARRVAAEGARIAFVDAWFSDDAGPAGFD